MAIKFLNTVAVDTDVLYVDASSNRVGIGTTSPQSPLHIYKSLNGGVGGELRLDNNNGAIANKTRILFSDGGGASGSFDRGAIVCETEASPYMGQLQFQTGIGTISTKMIILGNGNVGIGTTNPSSLLSVGNAATHDNPSTTVNIATTDTGSYLLKVTSDQFNADGNWVGIGLGYSNNYMKMGIIAEAKDSNARGKLHFAVNTTAGSSNASISDAKMTIDNAGNVGIGTTSPTVKLDVNASGVAAFFKSSSNQVPVSIFNTNSSVSTIGFKGSTTTNEYRVRVGANGNDFIAYTSNTERLRILDNGNVGINKTAPAARFHVNGSTIITLPSTGNYFKIEGDVDNNLFYAKNDSIGIGTTSPSEKLEVAGNAVITGDVTLSNGNALRWTSDDVRIEGTTAGDNIKFYVANTEILQLAQSGTLATVTGNLRVTGAYYDSSNSSGASGQVLSSTASGTDWVSLSEISGVDGTGTANYLAKWSDTDTITDSVIYDNGTNVGIGTASPSQKLHVYGKIKLEEANGGTLLSGNYGYFRVSPTNNYGVLVENNLDAAKYFSFGVPGDYGQIRYKENTSSAISVSATGVGIGTTSPTDKLAVNGNLSIFGNKIYNGSASNSAGVSFPNSTTRIDGYNGITFHSSATTVGSQSERMRITDSGNVGIGTTSPGRKLEVDFTGSVYGAKFTRSDAAGSSLIEFANSAGVKSIIGYDAGVDGYKIGTASATNLVVKQSGNVGIGTTSPSEKLHINGGNVLIQGGASTTSQSELGFTNAFDTAFIRSKYTNPSSTTETYLAFHTNTAGDTNNTVVEQMRIAGNKVGIGTITPQSKLQVAGGVQMADDTDAASADKVGTLRYRTSGNNSYVDMCMQTGATTYEWVNIVQNNW